eukprot:TRINITY_DN6026_c1_g5_i3.p2 TRINITY_DN6026_c1_g5~~TRINITY_DN6026_c1_g5_i3.p2  ORF type:complete len:424 (+),score=16.86 TRINITY_DN6026_c1_g5_i3:64-1335(+)
MVEGRQFLHRYNNKNINWSGYGVTQKLLLFLVTLSACFALLLSWTQHFSRTEQPSKQESQSSPQFDVFANVNNLPNVIRPGKDFYDVDKNLIQGHGGCILKHMDIYYWYGEIKLGPTVKFEPHQPEHIDLVGIACYSSRDLVNWKFEGNVLPASNDSNSKTYVLNVLERPKVIYHSKRRYFVLWFHFDTYDYFTAQVGVAKSNSPVGPFEFVKSFKPNDNDSRDMTLFKDSDGRVYLFYCSNWNQDMHVIPLTDDYLSVEDAEDQIILKERFREAPAVFKHGSRYLMMTSGCTGWDYNEARIHVANNVFGPWEDIGSPCMGTQDQCYTSFRSQDTFVLTLDEDKGLYLMMADRWVSYDLQKSAYVWLPLFVFDERMMDPQQGQDRIAVVVLWFSEWSFDQIQSIQQKLLMGTMVISQEQLDIQ